MVWQALETTEQFQQLLEESSNQPVVIFKHSTRCVISSMAKDRIERQWKEDIGLPFYYLDLLKYRDISNAIASETSVEHQSPQLLFISGGKCLYSATHGEINIPSLTDFIRQS